MEPSPRLGDVDLAGLFDEIITKTDRREAFSQVKEAKVGFSALDDMKALREEFLAAETELDLWFALVKLSNVRRDKHLKVIPVEGGLMHPEGQPCVSAPIRVLPEILDVQNPTFFVATVEEGAGAPQVGDVIEGVNGQSMKEHIDEASPFIRHSTLPDLYWDVARFLPRRLSGFPLSFYSERLHLDLKRPSGERYAVSLPYNDGCPYFSDVLRLTHPYAGFDRVMKRENFHLRIDRDREILLLIWLNFDPEHLIENVVDLVAYAEEQRMLDWDMVIDVTYSGGGTWGAYVVQRLVDQPFRPTFNNVRLSDQGKRLIERYAARSPRTGHPEIEGLDLSHRWLIDWARTDAREAIDRGDEWTEPVPLRLTHLPKDSDGILQPASVHFAGKKAIINAWTRGGSHLDQFVAMFVDNDLATFLGVPTGGYSNPYEGEEDLHFPGTSRPVARFMWTLGHTLRPNGEVLEGNPAQPDRYIPLTRENFSSHHRSLLEEAIAILGE